MPGVTPDVTCPHCGMVQNGGVMVQHIRVCLADPAVRERVRQALTDPDDPAHALSAARYNARRVEFGVPSESTLVKHHNDSWSEVCSTYGLLPPLSYLEKRAQDPDGQHVTCPHCGSNVDRANITRHERACAQNPAVREAVLLCLRDPQNPAHAISAEHYNARRVMFGAPGDKTLMLQYGGSWEAVYTDFGLERPLVYNRKITRAECPHCAGEFAPSVYDRHVNVCPRNPAMRDAIRTLMQDAAHPEFAVSPAEYNERAEGSDVARYDTLKRTFGGWAAAVKHFGLEPANSLELRQQREMDKVLAIARKEAQLLREDEQSAFALFVGDDDPRKPNYKQPIIHTDRVPPGYQRVMLR